tara:strand:- start:16417 stop:16902 length:486 start_codon:yes stop_codon:yes gene_type:complete
MSNSNLLLKEAKISDFDTYYLIRSEPTNLFWTGYKEPPNYQNFSIWYKERLRDNSRKLFLLYEGKHCVGSLNIDFYDGYAFIGYSVRENYEGKGFGTFIVKNAITFISERTNINSIKAWINFQNIGSIKVVEKNGFKRTTTSETRQRFGNEEPYFLYEIHL